MLSILRKWHVFVQKKIDFLKNQKIDFAKIQYFGIFRLSDYISAYFDDTMRRGLEKHADCLIFT